MMYLLIIYITMLADIGMTVGISLIHGGMSLAYAIISPLFVLAYVLVLLGLLDLVLRIFPKSMYNYKSKFYVASKREIRFYEKIGIRKWKDLVPELGATGGFSKRNIKSLEPTYIKRFLYETCFAEILHLLAALLGFTALFFFPPHHYYFVLPIVIVNFILNLLPCLIQRYNRRKLATLYYFLTRKEKRTSVETADSEQGEVVVLKEDEDYIQKGKI